MDIVYSDPKIRVCLKHLTKLVINFNEMSKAVAEGLEIQKESMRLEGMTEKEVNDYFENELPKDPDFIEYTNSVMKAEGIIGLICEQFIYDVPLN